MDSNGGNSIELEVFNMKVRRGGNDKNGFDMYITVLLLLFSTAAGTSFLTI